MNIPNKIVVNFEDEGEAEYIRLDAVLCLAKKHIVGQSFIDDLKRMPDAEFESKPTLLLDCGCSVRLYNILKAAFSRYNGCGFKVIPIEKLTLEDISSYPASQYKRLRHLGRKTYAELSLLLEKHNLSFEKDYYE